MPDKIEQPDKDNSSKSITDDNGTKIIELLTKISNQEELTTHVINLSNVKVQSTLDVLKIKEKSGKITEFAVISTLSTFSIYIKADGKEQFNKNSDFTTLSQIGGILNDIDADTTGGGLNRVVIRNIKFRKSIHIQLNTDSGITAQNIFCKYDLEKQETENNMKKECTTQ